MRKNILYGMASQLGTTVVSMVGNFFLFALIMRYLSAFDAGIWFTFMGVNILLSFCDFGFTSVLSNEIGLASYKHSLKLRIEHLYSNVTKTLYLFLMVAVVVAIIFYQIMLAKYTVENSMIGPAYWLFFLGFCFRLLSNAPLAVIYGLRKVALQMNLITLSTTVGFVLSIICLMKGYGLFELALSIFFSHLLLYIVSMTYVRYRLGYRIKFKLSSLVLKRIGKVSINWTLMNIGAILVLQIPAFVIVKLLGPEALPPFAVMKQMGSSILSFSIIVGHSSMPFISQKVGQNDTAGTQELFNSVVKYSTGIALYLAIFIFFMNHEIARIWLGKAEVFDQQILLIMFVGIVLESHHVAITKVCLSAGQVRFARIALIAGALVTVLSFLLIHLWGVMGAAIAIIVSQLLSNTWFTLWVAFKYLKVDRGSYFKVLKELFIWGSMLIIVMAGMRYCFPSSLDPMGAIKGLILNGCVSLFVGVGLLAFLNRHDFLLHLKRK